MCHGYILHYAVPTMNRRDVKPRRSERVSLGASPKRKGKATRKTQPNTQSTDMKKSIRKAGKSQQGNGIRSEGKDGASIEENGNSQASTSAISDNEKSSPHKNAENTVEESSSTATSPGTQKPSEKSGDPPSADPKKGVSCKKVPKKRKFDWNFDMEEMAKDSSSAVSVTTQNSSVSESALTQIVSSSSPASSSKEVEAGPLNMTKKSTVQTSPASIFKTTVVSPNNKVAVQIPATNRILPVSRMPLNFSSGNASSEGMHRVHLPLSNLSLPVANVPIILTSNTSNLVLPSSTITSVKSNIIQTTAKPNIVQYARSSVATVKPPSQIVSVMSPTGHSIQQTIYTQSSNISRITSTNMTIDGRTQNVFALISPKQGQYDKILITGDPRYTSPITYNRATSASASQSSVSESNSNTQCSSLKPEIKNELTESDSDQPVSLVMSVKDTKAKSESQGFIDQKPKSDIDLSDWKGYRVLAKKGGTYSPGVIKDVFNNTDVQVYLDTKNEIVVYRNILESKDDIICDSSPAPSQVLLGARVCVRVDYEKNIFKEAIVHETTNRPVQYKVGIIGQENSLRWVSRPNIRLLHLPWWDEIQALRLSNASCAMTPTTNCGSIVSGQSGNLLQGLPLKITPPERTYPMNPVHPIVYRPSLTSPHTPPPLGEQSNPLAGPMTPHSSTTASSGSEELRRRQTYDYDAESDDELKREIAFNSETGKFSTHVSIYFNKVRGLYFTLSRQAIKILFFWP